MSIQDDGKDSKGRDYDRVTRDGSSSAGTLGAGGTGDIGKMGAGQQSSRQAGRAGNAQAARTDDLLSPDAGNEQRDSYRPEEAAGELQTGLGGIGSLSTGNAGNRQSEGDSQPGGRAGAPGSDAGSGAARLPASGGQRVRK